MPTSTTTATILNWPERALRSHRRAMSAALILLAGTVAAARPSAPTPPGGPGSPPSTSPYTFHWAVTGPVEPQVDLSGMPIQRNVITFYEHTLGYYPRHYDGRIENGGIPQRADMAAHLTKARADIERMIPDPNWSGFAIIDYEQWDYFYDRVYPWTAQKSREWVIERFPHLSLPEINRRAAEEFEAAARDFTLRTLQLGKQLRPNAKWGFYMAPWFHNRDRVEQMRWLYDECTAFYPHAAADHFSITHGTPGPGQGMLHSYEQNLHQKFVFARQVAGDRPVIPFGWLRYYELIPGYEHHMLNQHDARALIRQSYISGADGVLFWDYITRPEHAAGYNQLISQHVRREVNQAISDIQSGVLVRAGGGVQPPQPGLPAEGSSSGGGGTPVAGGGNPAPASNPASNTAPPAANGPLARSPVTSFSKSGNAAPPPQAARQEASKGGSKTASSAPKTGSSGSSSQGRQGSVTTVTKATPSKGSAPSPSPSSPTSEPTKSVAEADRR